MWDTIWELIAIYGLLLILPSLPVFFIFARRFRQTSRPRIRLVSGIGLWLTVFGLLCLVVSVILSLQPPLLISSSASISNVPDTDISGLSMNTYWQDSQELHASTVVVVDILSTPSASPTVESGQTQVVSQLTPVGTSSVPIAQVFSAQYDVFARATLSASAFDIDPQPQPIQSLDQERVAFIWTVTPKYAGSQVLNISITGIWRPKGGGEEIERPLAGHLLKVQVIGSENSLFGLPLGLEQSGELIITFVGLMMSLPWIWVALKKRREKKRLVGLSIKTMQGATTDQRYGENTTMVLPNKITMQGTYQLQSGAEEKPIPYINIYISCSSNRRDVILLDELKKQLNILQRQLNVSLWERRLISPGAIWEQEISLYINQAHIILCLVSPDFLASNQCYEEMKLAIRKMDMGEILVIPLLMRYTAGWQNTLIGKLQPLPDDRVPLSGRKDREKAMSNIAEHIRQIVEQTLQDLASRGS